MSASCCLGAVHIYPKPSLSYHCYYPNHCHAHRSLRDSACLVEYLLEGLDLFRHPSFRGQNYDSLGNILRIMKRDSGSSLVGLETAETVTGKGAGAGKLA